MTNSKKIFIKNLYEAYSNNITTNYVPKKKEEIKESSFTCIYDNLTIIKEAEEAEIDPDKFVVAFFNYMSNGMPSLNNNNRYFDDLGEDYQKIVIDSSNKSIKHFESCIG